MTAAELIAELQKVPPDTLVVLSSDKEGNGYSEAHTVESLTPDEDDIGFGVPCVVIWP